ncbi:nucleoside hydrolase [Nocardioides KLBMP 9356]|uniref:Nucleoside hydrolase n=1 Tax=Nocardioides potassii TaxID=2911371 RepID=A0ABS9HE98_9ACTN|nr:nucleoside hydrolase [Nocardioides potassii]MCF6378631.1 nucleoside hydrolase [Nocardioides potassii]
MIDRHATSASDERAVTKGTRIVLDVDTGIDDALALLYAVSSGALDLCAVTTVSGNVPAERAAHNSTGVLAQAGAAHVPVAIGARRTTQGRGPRTGPTNHGPDGLGGVSAPSGPDPVDADPVDLLAEAARGGAVTLVGLAPMTNVARLAPHSDALVLVGGELVVEQPPEFNASHDAAATAEVIAAGRPTTLYVADVFERVAVAAADIDLLRGSQRPSAVLAGELIQVRRNHLIGDAGALVLLTHPHLFVTERRRIGMLGDVLTDDASGTLVDVVVDVDAAAVATAFVETMLGGA